MIAVLLAVYGFLVIASKACTITAKAYGSSSCLISLGSDTFGEDPQNTCFANNVGGYSTWYCISSTEIAVTYSDSESDCEAGTFTSTADYPENTCTYSDARGFYVKVCNFQSIVRLCVFFFLIIKCTRAPIFSLGIMG